MDKSNLLSSVKVVMGAGLRGFDLAVVSVSAVFAVVFTVADILHVPVAVVRASGAIAVTSVIVSLASIILSRRVVTTPAARGGHTTTTGGAFTAWGAIATRP